MNFGTNHATRAGPIARPIELQSNVPQVLPIVTRSLPVSVILYIISTDHNYVYSHLHTHTFID